MSVVQRGYGAVDAEAGAAERPIDLDRRRREVGPRHVDRPVWPHGRSRELVARAVAHQHLIGPGRPLGVLLGEVIDRIRKRSTLEIELTSPDDRDLVLGEVVENELLRISQEALTNVEKHANASRVNVAWTIERGRGTLYIHDNGRGFDPAKGIRGNAYGLVGMRERAASVGAILEVRSSPNEGTTITVLTSPTISGAHP